MHHPASKNNEFSHSAGGVFFVCKWRQTGRGAVLWFYVLEDKRGTPWWCLKTTRGYLMEGGRLECDVMTPLSHQSLSHFLCLSLCFWVFSLPASVCFKVVFSLSHRHHVSKPLKETWRLDGGGERDVVRRAWIQHGARGECGISASAGWLHSGYLAQIRLLQVNIWGDPVVKYNSVSFQMIEIYIFEK